MGEDSDDEQDKQPARPKAPVTHIPAAAPLSFPGAPKAESLVKKLGELNTQLDAALALSEEELAAVAALCSALADEAAPKEQRAIDLVFGKMLSWPSDKVLPAPGVVCVGVCVGVCVCR